MQNNQEKAYVIENVHMEKPAWMVWLRVFIDEATFMLCLQTCYEDLLWLDSCVVFFTYMFKGHFFWIQPPKFIPDSGSLILFDEVPYGLIFPRMQTRFTSHVCIRGSEPQILWTRPAYIMETQWINKRNPPRAQPLIHFLHHVLLTLRGSDGSTHRIWQVVSYTKVIWNVCFMTFADVIYCLCSG